MSKPTLNDPVESTEIETLSLTVAQAAAAVTIIADSLRGEANAHMALYLVSNALHGAATELDEMHYRHARTASAIDKAFATFTDGATANRPAMDGLPPAKRCPFCGSDEDIFILQTGTDDEPHYRASCGTCGVDAPGGRSVIDAAECWNTRGKLFQPGSRSHE